MGSTMENANALSKIASRTLQLSVDIEDHVKSFATNCNAIGESCQDLWPAIQSTAQTAQKNAQDASKILNNYARLMEGVSKNIVDALSSGLNTK